MTAMEKSEMTEQDLVDKLDDIRDFLSVLKDYYIGNIVFFNLESFFNFVSEKLGHGGLKKLLYEIEPYIPLVITENNLEHFARAVAENDKDMLKTISAVLSANSITIFIGAVYKAENDTDWQKIKMECLKIKMFEN